MTTNAKIPVNQSAGNMHFLKCNLPMTIKINYTNLL